jgi:hypothetical protein
VLNSTLNWTQTAIGYFNKVLNQLINTILRQKSIKICALLVDIPDNHDCLVYIFSVDHKL